MHAAHGEDGADSGKYVCMLLAQQRAYPAHGEDDGQVREGACALQVLQERLWAVEHVVALREQAGFSRGHASARAAASLAQREQQHVAEVQDGSRVLCVDKCTGAEDETGQALAQDSPACLKLAWCFANSYFVLYRRSAQIRRQGMLT